MVTLEVRITDNQEGETHVGLDVEVLEVESVLPHVDTNDRDQVQERVLVSSRGDLQMLGSEVQPLEGEINCQRSPAAVT